jgi:hypothetical protein
MKRPKLSPPPARIFVFLLFALAPLVSLAFAEPKSKPAAEGNKAFLSQAYVDTTVMRALYILNEASAHSMANKQSNAVAQSKAVLNELRAKAKGDPNERYALMKIQEIEAQIFLEEEEMRKIAEDKRIIAANQIVQQYNAEVGKMRPDFATLRGLFLRMSEVDRGQANKLADSYNKRYRAISRESMHALEKALVANDYVLALRELEYCERNRHYLVISSAELARQRARLESIKGREVDVSKITAQLDYGEAAYKGFRLSESRASLSMARDRIHEVKLDMPANEWNPLSARANKLIKDLDAREDSLVRAAISVLESRGVDAAYKYLHDELQAKHSISYERAAVIDQIIINRSPQKAVNLESKHKVKMVEFPEESASNYDMLSSLEDKARWRAQERADSLRMVQEKAEGIRGNIYALIGKKKAGEAKKIFKKEQAFLASVLERDSYGELERTVAKGKIAVAKPAPAKPAPVAKKSGGSKKDAKVAKSGKAKDTRAAKSGAAGDGRATASVGAASSGAASSGAASSGATGGTATAAAPSAGSGPSGYEKAQAIAVLLYELVEREEIMEAHKRFQQTREPLKKYLDADTYNMLEFTIIQSYNYVLKK